jgi:D-3-phosphoglycerate dehydrogenase
MCVNIHVYFHDHTAVLLNILRQSEEYLVRIPKYFIIDFDSTFTKVEALDVLGEISLADDPGKAEKLQEIKEITNRGMQGKMSFRESLHKRIALLSAHKNHLSELIEKLREEVSDSFKRNPEFFETHADYIYILSSGFREFIEPIVTAYGIKIENVFANTFKYDDDGSIVGFDESNVLCEDHGKVKQVQALNLDGDVSVIGDGYTDYEIKQSGLANKFFAFTENVSRESVLDKADHVAPSLDEVLYLSKMNRAISYPKSRISVLLLEGIHPQAARAFKEEGYQLEVHSAAMDEDELCAKLEKVSILGIRSKTHITPKVLESANRLIAVGAFCIGTNQIDLTGCLNKGVAVFNAPYSNTRSVVELAVAEIVMLLRNVTDRSREMHDGVWNKSAQGSNEIRGKKLGIVGYGNIGSQLSVLAENMGMGSDLL